MEETIPLPIIPETWAALGHCPVCQMAKLYVQHTPSQPDRMACGQCGAAYMLEKGGARIYLIKGPAALVSRQAGKAQAWLPESELRAML
jgi:rubredoxin